MAKTPLFSTYRQGENRVTSSILAVFERLDLSLTERLLGAAAGESSLAMVTFSNQPPGQGHSVPDARISAHFSYWFEVKTVQNSLTVRQLREHLQNLGHGGDERLFAITPDVEQPEVIAQLGDPQLVWFNFRALYDAIEQSTADPTAGISEQHPFLLRELQALLVNDGLIDNDDVVVVAARLAYPEYLARSLYICQPGRPFRGGLSHLAFYTDGAIQVHVPLIRYQEDYVVFAAGEIAVRSDGSGNDRLIAAVIEQELQSGTRPPGEPCQVFLLSAPDDPDTIMLPQPIRNDTRAASGRLFAWTIGQRYVSLSALTRPGVSVTSDLD